MKKTIAILLILVIGMVGVFAADGLATGPKDTAKITIDTVVPSFVHFSLDAPTRLVATVDFSSVGAFLNEDNGLVDLIEYDEEDFDLTDFASDVELATIWGINNTSTDKTLSITSVDGFVGDDGTTKIPLTITLVNKTIGKASGTTLGTLSTDNIISAKATTPAQVFTALAQGYTATITIEVSGS